MKQKPLSLGIIFATLTLSASAITVIDPTLIRTEMANAQRRLVEDLVRARNQATQIAKAVEQINQIEEWLRRVGDLEEIDIDTILEAQRLLEQILSSKTGFEIAREAQLEDLLIAHPVYGQPVTREIIVDGQVVAERDLDPYLPERVAQASFVAFHEAHQVGVENKKRLKEQLDDALTRLDGAATQAEVLKLQVLIEALSSMLRSNDTEMQLAADAAMLRYAQNQNEARIAGKARAQNVRARERRAVEQIPEVFAPFTQPVFFNQGNYD